MSRVRPAERPPAGPRAVAVRRLLRVEEGGAHVARLGASTADAETSRLALEIVAGVTRHRRWLDFLIGRFYRGRVDALDAPLRQILRIGAHDLVVAGTPPHAAVSEAVELAAREMHRGAAGLANAVLRAIARHADRLPLPDTGDPADDLGVRHSHPTWMVRRWLGRWGEEATVRLLEHDNAPPRFGLRATDGDAAALLAAIPDADAAPSRWLDDFVTVGRLQPIVRAGLLADGRAAVQDEAAGLVVRVLAPVRGERVLDGAAAPGGKAVYAALRGAVVTALDVSEAKTALVRQAAEAQGVASLTAVTADLRTWPGPDASGGTRFDAVLLDAPCSGTGVLAKRADLRWRRDESDLAGLAALQDELLDAAARHVRPGGRLVYATCSLEPEENDDRVAAFLARAPGWRREPVAGVPDAFVTPAGTYEALPHVHGTDGAFAAVLRAPDPP